MKINGYWDKIDLIKVLKLANCHYSVNYIVVLLHDLSKYYDKKPVKPEINRLRCSVLGKT